MCCVTEAEQQQRSVQLADAVWGEQPLTGRRNLLLPPGAEETAGSQPAPERALHRRHCDTGAVSIIPHADLGQLNAGVSYQQFDFTSLVIISAPSSVVDICINNTDVKIYIPFLQRGQVTLLGIRYYWNGLIAFTIHKDISFLVFLPTFSVWMAISLMLGLWNV